MSDTKDKNTKKTLSLKPANTVKLTKTVGLGQIRPNTRGGGAKPVTVERRRTRSFSRDEAGHMVEVSQAEAASKANETSEEDSTASKEEAILNAKGLTDSERQARLQALRLAAERAEEENKAKEERERLQEEARKQEEEQAKQDAILQAEKQAEDEKIAKKRAEEEQRAREESEKKAKQAPAADVTIPPVSTPEDLEKAKERSKLTLKESSEKLKKAPAGKPKSHHDEKRRSGKLTLTNALDQDGQEKQRSLASIKRAREKARRKEMGEAFSTEKKSREVILPEFITVQELANRMAERAVDVIRSLMKMGSIATAHQTIDADTAELVATEFGHTVKRVTDADVENILIERNDDEADVEPRGPVVTVMGHVDHGKTSLLDALRQTDVTAGEAGGITQHIGAYQVQMPGGDCITFLDTPGHEAFTEIRSRGAKVTDIVVLVVAADDGIKQQTVEAINHAKAAEVPIIVAVNKIDKPDADPSRILNELLEHELVAEDLGGDIMVVPISAKQKTNLDKLEEAILLQAEMLELKANPNRTAIGTVIESKVDKGKGVIATLLVQRGTLQKGDIVLAGTASGTVRALTNDKGRTVHSAGPSIPVEMIGLDEAPSAGEQFHVLSTERQAREIVDYRKKRVLDMRVAAEKRGTLEQLFSKAANEGAKELPVIVKGDVQGSTEAIVGGLEKLSNDEVNIRVIHSAVGGITESDINLANTSGALVVAFNVRATPQARELADKEHVDVRYYSVIYNLIDDAKAILGGMLDPVKRENYLGVAEIRQVFKVSKTGKVAGCFVTDGIIKRGAGVRLLRDNIVIHEGHLKTLKRFKDDAKEVKSGYECGMAFENYDDIKEGDVIEAFEVVEEARTLE